MTDARTWLRPSLARASLTMAMLQDEAGLRMGPICHSPHTRTAEHQRLFQVARTQASTTHRGSTTHVRELGHLWAVRLDRSALSEGFQSLLANTPMQHVAIGSKRETRRRQSRAVRVSLTEHKVSKISWEQPFDLDPESSEGQPRSTMVNSTRVECWREFRDSDSERCKTSVDRTICIQNENGRPQRRPCSRSDFVADLTRTH